jgi:hypothetical protein
MAITIDGADNKLEIGANATGPSSLRLYEDTDNGTNYVSIIAPSAVTSNRTITLPDATGTLVTNSGSEAGAFSTLTVNSNNISAENSLGFRNRIINGDMRIDQRNAGASITLPDSTTTYTLDRWFAFENGSMVFSIQRSSTAPTSFTNSILITTTTGAVAGASERSQLCSRIEGFNVADLTWGTANAKTVTLSFWIRSSLTGQFGGSLQNVNADRSYPFSFTISAANTFEYKTITITGDTTGTWATDNSTGIQLNFDLGMGSSLLGTAGAWAAADYRGATGDTKLSGTTGATMYITGVQLEVGSVATPFERRDYGRELAMCQRYFVLCASATNEPLGLVSLNTTTSVGFSFFAPVTMRAAPTILSTIATYRVNWQSSGANSTTAPTISFASTQVVNFDQGGYTGLTAGNAGIIRSFDPGRLALSSEL